jgi:site-specific recombinase
MGGLSEPKVVSPRHTAHMQTIMTLSTETLLACIHAALPSQRHHQRDLPRLADRLYALIAADDLPDRLDAWLALTSWLSGGALWNDVYIDSADVHGSATQRFAVLMDVLAADPGLAGRVRHALYAILDETDGANLFGEVGIPSDRGFLSEFADRLTSKLIPSPRDDHDLGHLMSRSFERDKDLTLIRGLQPSTFQRAVDIFFPADEPVVNNALQRAMADGFRLLLARVQGQGLSLKLRARSEARPVARSPFKCLANSGENLLCAWEQGRLSGPLLEAWETDLSACRDEIHLISTRHESEGISVDIVYGLDVLDRCLTRMETIVGVMSAEPGASGPVLLLLRQLAHAAHESTSLRHLVRSNLQRLQRRIVDRAGKTGEHYIADTPADYRHIWLAAAGGGLLTVGTAAIKMAIVGAGLAMFLEGLGAGINYAVSFLFLQAFGLILATKQPAMTAAAFAAIIRDRKGNERLDVIVDYAASICHSQLAATIANVVVVASGAYAFDAAWRWMTGHAFLSTAEATYVFKALSPVDSGTVFYAALTGGILYLAALVGGWVDNWAVYHRLPQAIAEHRLGNRFGQIRMIRLAGIVSRNMSGWATNISLGLMLGMTPILGQFFGLPLDVRHVTLNSGILSLATSSLEVKWIGSGLLSLALLGVAVMFVLNLGVSFALSLMTAVRAYDLPRNDLRELRRRLWLRLRTRPLDFIRPPRNTPA